MECIGKLCLYDIDLSFWLAAPFSTKWCQQNGIVVKV